MSCGCFTLRRNKSPSLETSEHVNFVPTHLFHMGQHTTKEPPVATKAEEDEETYRLRIDGDLEEERPADLPPSSRLSYGHLTVINTLPSEPSTNKEQPLLRRSEEHIEVVVKRYLSDSKGPKDFQQEYRLLRDVLGPHPNLVRVFSCHDNYGMLCMPRYRGCVYTLMCDPSVALDSRDVRNLFAQMATAVAYCHARLVAHRDVKLENFLVDVRHADPRPYTPDRALVKLTDFEFSSQFRDMDALVEVHCGSVNYASPELLSSHPYSPFASDVWALGVALHVMQFREYPFGHPSGTAKQTAQAIVNTRLRLDDTCTGSLRRVLEGTMCHNVPRRLTASKLVVHDYITTQDVVDRP